MSGGRYPFNAQSEKGFQEANARIETEGSSRFDKEKVDALQAILNDAATLPDRRRELQAVLTYIDARWNVAPMNKSKMLLLFANSKWPACFEVPKSEDTIGHFLTDQHKTKSTSIGAFLYLLWVLSQTGHPCLDEAGRSLLNRSRSYLSFARELSDQAGEGRTAAAAPQFISRREMQQSLDKFLGRPGEAHEGYETEPERTDRDVLELTRNWLFSSVSPENGRWTELRENSDLPAIAIRFGSTGKFVVSNLRFNLIRGATTQPLGVHVSTWTKNDPRQHRSQGLIVSRLQHIYFLQYHSNGSGLNVMSFPAAQFAESAAYYGGLVLGVDRAGNDSALASRVIVIRKNLPMEKTGEVLATNINGLLASVGLTPAHIEDALDFLRDRGSKIVRADAEGGTALEIGDWHQLQALRQRQSGDVVAYAKHALLDRLD